MNQKQTPARLQQLAGEAAALFDKAAAENRELTPAEREEAERKVAQFRDLRSKEQILDVAGRIGAPGISDVTPRGYTVCGTGRGGTAALIAAILAGSGTRPSRLSGASPPLPPAGRLPVPASSEHTCDPPREVHRYGLPLLSPRLHVVGSPDRRRSKPGDRLGEVLPPGPSVRLRARGLQDRRHLGEPYEVLPLPSHWATTL